MIMNVVLLCLYSFNDAVFGRDVAVAVNTWLRVKGTMGHSFFHVVYFWEYRDCGFMRALLLLG